MATIIDTINDERFSLNGVPYFKNFTSFVVGNQIQIFSAYDRKFELMPFTDFNDVVLNGTTHGSVAALQTALLSVIYTRSTLGTGTTTATTAEVTVFGQNFFLRKHPNNNNPANVNTLQLNDMIFGGWRSANEFWYAARYRTLADINDPNNWEFMTREKTITLT